MAREPLRVLPGAPLTPAVDKPDLRVVERGHEGGQSSLASANSFRATASLAKVTMSTPRLFGRVKTSPKRRSGLASRLLHK